jgi:hypothetical protein
MKCNRLTAITSHFREGMMKHLLISTLCIISGSLTAGEPKVVNVSIAKASSQGARTISVTVKHGDTGWKHYADAFEISTPNGRVLNTRVLAHPHVNEQPFERDAYGVIIPDGVSEILVRAKDSVHGFGKAVRVEIPRD